MMADRSNIEWTDCTDNIIVVEGHGWWCRKKNLLCKNCYAEALNDNSFFKGNHLPYSGKPPKLVLRCEMIARWSRQTKPRKHFVASMTDVMGEWVKRSWHFEMLDGMLAAPLQTFQILTKRGLVMLTSVKLWMIARGITAPPSHIWLGFSAGTQDTFDEEWQHVKHLAAMGWTIFVSCEPLLGQIILPKDFLALGRRAQVIVGGESGKKARPMHPEWARSLRDQCLGAGVSFFFKQWGEWLPVATPRMKWTIGDSKLLHIDGSIKDATWSDVMNSNGAVWAVQRVGKEIAGRVLDGRTWEEFPHRELLLEN
jgi:protein gp37